MKSPLVSVIIPTHNRPQLVIRAVKSALEQTVDDLEVIVVDDASTQVPELPKDNRLRLIRLSQSHGGAGTRNVGLKEARGRWVTFLDDDDQLLPNMLQISLDALSKTNVPPPVAVISGLEVVNAEGQVICTRLPPPIRPQAAHFSLEEIELGKSYNTKQTLVVEREVLNRIGGWDETFRSRVHSELFLRLNLACTIIGLPVVGYRLCEHEGPRVSRNTNLRQESFQRLVGKHKSIFKAHPKMFADFVYEHALTSYKMGQKGAALYNFCWAIKLHPSHTLSRFTPLFRKRLMQKLIPGKRLLTSSLSKYFRR
jgi:glycosyltransferase involved in cell wall biosynthesis